MIDKVRIGIIGAGMTGLACARALAEAGHAPVLLDKGRGIGGRLATRRADHGLQFDHGAQYVTAKSAGFRAALDELGKAGAVADWDMGDRHGFVGVPSMNAMAKAIGSGLDVRRQVQVSALQESAGEWIVSAGDEHMGFDRLIVTAPVPQTIALLGEDHPLSREIRAVRLLPSWTLMAAFSTDPAPAFQSARAGDGPLAWVAREGAKPGRTDLAAYVVQAGAGWSAAHLEEDKDDVARMLLDALCDKLSADPVTVRHAAAHRWRYARVDKPLGRDFVRNPQGTLYLGGDWCLGARVEAAWQSGTAIAEDLLENLR